MRDEGEGRGVVAGRRRGKRGSCRTKEREEGEMRDQGERRGVDEGRRRGKRGRCGMKEREEREMRDELFFSIKILLEHLQARLAQSVEHETLNLRVVGSSPTLGVITFVITSKRAYDDKNTFLKGGVVFSFSTSLNFLGS